jgi:hypothetical protein
MVHEGPSSLPTFYGEKTPEGRIVKRTSDEEDLLATSPMTNQEKAPDHGHQRESAFGPEPPSASVTGGTRWTLDDARREEYWKGYWDRKRLERERERESHWYPDYRGPMRYIEYPDDEDRPRAIPRSASRRETRPMPPRPLTRGGRRSMEADILPVKRPAETEYDEEYVEMIYPEGRGGSKRSPPREYMGHKPSFDETSISMRLPFLSWMGNKMKGRTFLLTSPHDSAKRLIPLTRFCRGFRRVCRHDDVLIFCLRWNTGCQCRGEKYIKYYNRIRDRI